MANYVVDRLSNMREPRSTSEIRERYERIGAKDIDSLLVTLAGPGRTGIALIGKDRSQ